MKKKKIINEKNCKKNQVMKMNKMNEKLKRNEKIKTKIIK